MKELYSHWLRIQCEAWMKENLPDLFQVSYERVKKMFEEVLEEEAPVAQDEFLISQIDMSVGPWKSVIFHFKEPGEIIFPLEKCKLSYLRERNNLVLIIRCLEDFQTLMQTYFYMHMRTGRTMYSIKSA
ncbi:hypothetical protein [Xanthocytophaga agilis]|uniref:Uncharacterized protein n=1 Tax=Xanthocytophaga agilis TaxID=3048010 RepID=A0AAE3UC48_9BACT|nr:hypothetical protein [Xanthocytophaga agilis]MDJ1500548.1 hypothetical protein [Xanthocytophaga agilis]